MTITINAGDHYYIYTCFSSLSLPSPSIKTEKARMTTTIKNALKKYLTEIITIFIGISISFWFDEWRSTQKDREMEQKLLLSLKENLVQDTFQLTHTIPRMNGMLYSIQQLIQFQNAPHLADSVDFYIDMAASYTGILNNQTTYEEMKQTGYMRLIQDDTLKKAILGHYTTLIPYGKEWCDVDKTHTMTQLIPEMSRYFPVVIDTTVAFPASQKIAALKTPKLRHLIITNLAYKKEALNVVKMTNANTKKLIARIDKALKK
jgi:hypothetical protein